MAIDVSSTRDLVLQVIDIGDRRWVDFAAKATRSLFQAPRWCRLIAGYYGFPAHVLAATRGGEIVGGLPFAVIDDFRGRRHISFPFSDYCEPLGEPPWAVYEQYITASGVPWTLRGRIPAPSPADPAGMCLELALPASMEEAERKFHQKQKVNARRLERAGATFVRVDDARILESFYPLYVTLRKEKFRLLPQGRGFFEAVVAEYFPDRGFGLAVELDGVIAAAGIFLAEGDMLYIKYSATSQEMLDLRPSNYLFRQGIEAAIEGRYKALDLGASRHEGIIRFKEHLGAESSPFFEHRYSVPEKPEAAKSVEATIDRLTHILTEPDVPLAAAQSAGDALYRYFV